MQGVSHQSAVYVNLIHLNQWTLKFCAFRILSVMCLFICGYSLRTFHKCVGECLWERSVTRQFCDMWCESGFIKPSDVWCNLYIFLKALKNILNSGFEIFSFFFLSFFSWAQTHVDQLSSRGASIPDLKKSQQLVFLMELPHSWQQDENLFAGLSFFNIKIALKLLFFSSLPGLWWTRIKSVVF